jgi:hypothetical protein
MEHTTIAVDLAKSVFQVAVSHRPGRVDEKCRLSRDRFLEFFARRPRDGRLGGERVGAHFWVRQLHPFGHLHLQFVVQMAPAELGIVPPFRWPNGLSPALKTRFAFARSAHIAGPRTAWFSLRFAGMATVISTGAAPVATMCGSLPIAAKSHASSSKPPRDVDWSVAGLPSGAQHWYFCLSQTTLVFFRLFLFHSPGFGGNPQCQRNVVPVRLCLVTSFIQPCAWQNAHC